MRRSQRIQSGVALQLELVTPLAQNERESVDRYSAACRTWRYVQRTFSLSAGLCPLAHVDGLGI